MSSPPASVKTKGRSLKMDDRRESSQTGQMSTIADCVCELIALGLTQNSAAISVGISPATLHNWRKKGAEACAKRALRRELTPDEVRYADFLWSLENAEVEQERIRVENIRGVAKGGGIVTEVVEEFKTIGLDEETKEPIELLVSRKVTKRQMPPNWQADMTWLERRMPDKYRRRTEVTGADGSPLIPSDDEARQLAGELRAFQQGLEDAKSDAKTGG